MQILGSKALNLTIYVSLSNLSSFKIIVMRTLLFYLQWIVSGYECYWEKLWIQLHRAGNGKYTITRHRVDTECMLLNKSEIQRLFIEFFTCNVWFILDVPDWSLPFLSTVSQSNEAQTSGKVQFHLTTYQTLDVMYSSADN